MMQYGEKEVTYKDVVIWITTPTVHSLAVEEYLMQAIHPTSRVIYTKFETKLNLLKKVLLSKGHQDFADRTSLLLLSSTASCLYGECFHLLQFPAQVLQGVFQRRMVAVLCNQRNLLVHQ